MPDGRVFPHRWIIISILVVGSRFTAGGSLLGHRAVTYIRRCWAELQAATDTNRLHDVSKIHGRTSEDYKKRKEESSSNCSNKQFSMYIPTAVWTQLDFYKWGQLTLILLMWRIWWAPNNASKWEMGFNLAFKGLKFQAYSAQKENDEILITKPNTCRCTNFSNLFL